MELVTDKEYKIFAKITTINLSDGQNNVAVYATDGSTLNIKVKKEVGEQLIVGKVYEFTFKHLFNGTRHYNQASDCAEIFSLPFSLELEKAARFFYPASSVDSLHAQKVIEAKIAEISNKAIKDITVTMFKKFESRFYIYPAAQKMHHAYIGGLAAHTSSMLVLAEAIANVYPFLLKDYLYAGIILHDILKVVEFTEPVDPDYSVAGTLIGHITLSCLEINKTAHALGLENSEEALVLEHIILAHHGQYNFGSPKKPATMEAFVVSMIDGLDSKLQTLKEELDLIAPGELTQPLLIMERARIYKPKN